jgi:tight adherence protein C
MTGTALLAASLAALAAFLLARSTVHVPMRLAARVDPYTNRVRQRLTTVIPVHSTEPARSAWGPLLATITRAVGRAAEAGQTDELDRRLRHAGLAHMTVEDYRRRQLAAVAVAALASVVLAGLLRVGPGVGLLLVAAAVLFGATRWRSKLDRLTEQRRTVMQAEAHVICQLLAVYLRTGDTPMAALDRLCQRADGVIPAELASAAAVIRRGKPAAEILDRLAADTTEPAAARLYRLYAAGWQAAGNPTALMALAEQLRSTRREELARRMARKRTAMVLPLVMVIGPILILFVGAAIPSIVLGR